MDTSVPYQCSQGHPHWLLPALPTPSALCLFAGDRLWPWALPGTGTEQAQCAGRGGRDAAGSLPSFLAPWGALPECVLGQQFSEFNPC